MLLKHNNVNKRSSWTLNKLQISNLLLILKVINMNDNLMSIIMDIQIIPVNILPLWVASELLVPLSRRGFAVFEPLGSVVKRMRAHSPARRRWM